MRGSPSARGIASWKCKKRILLNALEQARTIDVKAIIETGVKGPDIKAAVRDARCEAVNHVLIAEDATQK